MQMRVSQSFSAQNITRKSKQNELTLNGVGFGTLADNRFAHEQQTVARPSVLHRFRLQPASSNWWLDGCFLVRVCGFVSHSLLEWSHVATDWVYVCVRFSKQAPHQNLFLADCCWQKAHVLRRSCIGLFPFLFLRLIRLQLNQNSPPGVFSSNLFFSYPRTHTHAHTHPCKNPHLSRKTNNCAKDQSRENWTHGDHTLNYFFLLWLSFWPRKENFCLTCRRIFKNLFSFFRKQFNHSTWKTRCDCVGDLEKGVYLRRKVVLMSFCVNDRKLD